MDCRLVLILKRFGKLRRHTKAKRVGWKIAEGHMNFSPCLRRSLALHTILLRDAITPSAKMYQAKSP
jgi:hypothetical protein